MDFYDQLLEQTCKSTDERMSSVTTGKVVKNWDKDHPGMVQVELFLSESGKNRTDWVRVAQPYAGKNFGFYFLPEVGDEVVLAFNQGDRDHPIVIGSLWSKVNPTPEDALSEKNDTKTLRTKSGNELAFSDESKKEAVLLHTKGNLTLLMDDAAHKIYIQDKDEKNIVTIDSESGTITVKAKNKVVLEVGDGSLTLDQNAKKATLAMSNIEINAKQSIKLKGQNVAIEGAMTDVKANGNMNVKAGGILTLKGAMAKIN